MPPLLRLVPDGDESVSDALKEKGKSQSLRSGPSCRRRKTISIEITKKLVHLLLVHPWKRGGGRK